jgi:septal ring factor EnvC (AmiA/AmiB activator)
MARAFACMLAMVLIASGGVALAQQDSLEAAKRRELELLSQQAKENRAQAGALKGQETRALGDLKRTERELSSTRKRLKLVTARRERLDDQLELTQANLKRSEATLAVKREQLARRLRHVYMVGPARDLEFLVSTRSFAGLMMRWDFLQMLAEQDRLLLESVETEKDRVEANKHRLEGNLKEVSVNTQRTSKETGKLTNLRQSRASSVAQIQSKREEYEAAAADLERSARAVAGLLARLERSRQAESTKARGGAGPQPCSATLRGQDGRRRATSWATWGSRRTRASAPVRNDGGISVRSAPVRVVAKGRVDFANDDYEGVGGMVVLNHGDGYYTIYSHLSEVSVSTGTEIQAGTVLGRSGEEGSLKGPVLHFEVRKGSTPLNPESWLR